MADHSDVIPELEGIEELEFDEAFHKKLCGMLDRVPLLREFEYSELQTLAHYCHVYKAAQGSLIFREGQPGNIMYLLVDGYVALIKGEKQLGTVREGKTMGEMSMLDNKPYSATAISGVESTFIVFDRKEFGRLMNEQAPIALKLLIAISTLLSTRLRETTDLLVDRL